MKIYRHSIPLHIILSIWTILYLLPFFIVLIKFIIQYSAIWDIKVIIFYILFTFSISLILFSTFALLLKKNWSIAYLSIGLHSFILSQIYAFILCDMSLYEAFFSFVCFTFPIFPIVFILHSKYFMENFNNERNDNEVTPLDQNSAPRKSGK